MTRAIVVTGTDTEIGKTVFAAGLTAALRAKYWKPIQAGLEEDANGNSDAARVASLGVPQDAILPEAYRLTTPCSPHRAAELDGLVIDPARLALPNIKRDLVIEGAGGALVPITRDLLYADLFARWRAPVVIVSRTALGTINHSLMTIEALRSRGVPILGMAFVGAAQEDSEATICSIGKVARLGRLPIIDPLNAETLAAEFADAFTLGDFA